ncbi:MAG: septum formation initiator family protein [Rikenellaceae bacterium]|nr:septum formation initiator family protein [Rikenellaceae bacterium]MBO7168600.1 septum formation initiator family protein [Rikenellaceae bacterium]
MSLLREKISELSLRAKILGALILLAGMIVIGNEFVRMIRLRFEIAELRDRIEYYQERLQQDSLLIQRLESPEYLERYAREKYYMHAKDEDIYIIR